MASEPRTAHVIMLLAVALFGEACFAFSIEDTEFRGDLRLRYQYDHEAAADSSAQRHRGRARLRFGFQTRVNGKVDVGVRLASGQADNRSTNQTFVDFFSTKSVGLDMAYAAWKPAAGLGFLFGKYRGGLLIFDDLAWDRDINFEGASVLWERSGAGGTGATANGGLFLIDEGGSGSMVQYMLYVQPGVSFTAGDLAVSAAVAYYDFENVKGSAPGAGFSAGTNTLVDGRLEYDYDNLNPVVKLSYAGDGPGGGYVVSLLGDYIYNFDSGDSGFLVGFGFGHREVEERAFWTAHYSYRRLERDAVMDVFPDSDFYGGATDARGHEVIFRCAVAHGAFIALDYYRAERIEGDKDPLDTFQADCEFKF